VHLLTLDSKFIKIADLVACLARSSCTCSTTDREKASVQNYWYRRNKDDRNGKKGNRIETILSSWKEMGSPLNWLERRRVKEFISFI